MSPVQKSESSISYPLWSNGTKWVFFPVGNNIKSKIILFFSSKPKTDKSELIIHNYTYTITFDVVPHESYWLDDKKVQSGDRIFSRRVYCILHTNWSCIRNRSTTTGTALLNTEGRICTGIGKRLIIRKLCEFPFNLKRKSVESVEVSFCGFWL